MALMLKFDIVTPEKQLFSKDIEMVVIPGEEGDFGVLYNHAPLISGIRPGVISIYNGHNISERIFVSGGFAEVTGERCTVLATEAVSLAGLTISDVENRLKKANDSLLDVRNDNEKIAAEKEKFIAEQLVKAVRV